MFLGSLLYWMKMMADLKQFTARDLWTRDTVRDQVASKRLAHIHIKVVHKAGFIRPVGFGTPGKTGGPPILWEWDVVSTHRTSRCKLPTTEPRCAPDCCTRKERCARYMAPLSVDNATVEDFSTTSSNSVCLAFIPVVLDTAPRKG